MLLSYMAYCGFTVFPSEEPFLPSEEKVDLLLEASDLFLHVPEHAFGLSAGLLQVVVHCAACQQSQYPWRAL